MISRLIAVSVVLWAILPSGLPVATGAPKPGMDRAEVTQIVREVQFLELGASSRPARIGDVVRGKSSVSTGTRSRAELSFPDNTLLRLGSNTTFSIGDDPRELNLKRGTVLLQTAPGGDGVNIRSGSISAAISGSLGLYSVAEAEDPDNPDTALMLKLVSVHGDMSLVIEGPPKRTIRLEPGQILFMPLNSEGVPTGEPRIASIDLNKLVRSSRLIDGFPSNERIGSGEIGDVLGKLLGEKQENRWTEVAVPRQKKPGKFIIDLGALIKPFVPPPPPVIEPVIEVKPPPPRPRPRKKKNNNNNTPPVIVDIL